jgi:N-methylhydantoinase A
MEVRAVYFDDGWLDVPVYERSRMPAGARFSGPALVEEMGSVTVVPPDWNGMVGDFGELTLIRGLGL